MNITEKRILLKEEAFQHLVNAKIEPLQYVKLLKYIDEMDETKLNKKIKELKEDKVK